MAATLPLSIVVPLHDSADTLDAALSAIVSSDLARDTYEIIVVDDASTDESAVFAARYADTVVRLTGLQNGFAYARNRGAELARGEMVAFVDADVRVRPDTLKRMMQALASQPWLDAISAAQDDTPAAPNFVSQYWNLMLYFSQARRPAAAPRTMSGCSVIRRKALLSAGMYDEWRFTGGRLEGVDLGMRLHMAGLTVLLSQQMKVTQMKRWNLRSLLEEVWHRSKLLSRGLGYRRARSAVPCEVVFTLSEPLSPPLAIGGTVAVTAAFVTEPQWLTLGAIAGGMVFLLNVPVHRFFLKSRGFFFAIAITPLHLLVQAVAGLGLIVGWLLRDMFGDATQDAATQAYAEVGVEIWPPVRRQT